MWREELKELAETIRSHPQFPLANRRFATDFVAWRGGLGVLNKVLSNLAREHIFEHALYLHFARDPGDLDDGATFERLAALSESRDEIGARAVRTGLHLAQIAGLFILRRSRSDARQRIYEPTEPLIAMTREYSALAFQVLDDIAPNLNLSARIRHEHSLTPALLARMGEIYLNSEFRRHRDSDRLTNLMRLDGGRAVLAAVVDCHWRQIPLPTAQEFARLFYVSPSQIRAILKSAELHGLVRGASRGLIIDAEPLANAYLDAQARYLAFSMRYGLGLDRAALATKIAAV